MIWLVMRLVMGEGMMREVGNRGRRVGGTGSRSRNIPRKRPGSIRRGLGRVCGGGVGGVLSVVVTRVLVKLRGVKGGGVVGRVGSRVGSGGIGGRGGTCSRSGDRRGRIGRGRVCGWRSDGL